MKSIEQLKEERKPYEKKIDEINEEIAKLERADIEKEVDKSIGKCFVPKYNDEVVIKVLQKSETNKQFGGVVCKRIFTGNNKLEVDIGISFLSDLIPIPNSVFDKALKKALKIITGEPK